jgi:hypothetical protein
VVQKRKEADGKKKERVGRGLEKENREGERV